MTDEEIKKLARQTRSFFRRGLPHYEMRDLVQEVLLHFLEKEARTGSTHGQTVDQACIDVTRRIHGEMNENRWGKRPLQYTSFDVQLHGGQTSGLEPMLDLRWLLEQLSEKLPPHLYTMLELYYLEDFTFKEIGAVFNYSESAISYIFKRVIRPVILVCMEDF